MITTLMGFELPQSWEYIDKFKYTSMRCYRRTKDDLTVIETQAPDIANGEEQEWLHISMSYNDKLPSYEDMRLVKSIFVGPAHTALQIFPPETKHISIHDYCLHLWVPLEYDVTPDFGDKGTI